MEKRIKSGKTMVFFFMMVFHVFEAVFLTNKVFNKQIKTLKPTNKTLNSVKRGLAVFVVFIMIAVGFSGWVMRNASSSITGNLPPVSGDWIITEESAVFLKRTSSQV